MNCDDFRIWSDISFDPDCMFVDGDITRNIGFVGIVYCSVFIRRSESC